VVISKGENLFLIFAKFIYSLTQASPEKPEGTVTTWSILPEDPLEGDVLTIKGRTEPGTVIDVSVSFSRYVDVKDGRYEYSFEGIRIPKGRNRFAVNSRKVKDLNFIVRMFIDLKRSFDAKEGVAEFAEDNVPHGTYDIFINGEAQEGEKEVRLDFTAMQTIGPDSDGNFNHNYETNALPAGDFTVLLGNSEKKITLGPAK
jgi:hypothetical protein